MRGRRREEEGGSITRRIGTVQHFRWLWGIVVTVLILNVLDAVLTFIWVYTGKAEEANPVLKELVQNDPGLFMAVKFLLVGLGSILLWRQRKRPIAVVAIFVGFLVYYFILLYHLQSMNLRLVRRFFD